jgi:putative hydrolase of the HAD superfamily
LRRRNITIGVCSNWGWDLKSFLEDTGVAPLVDTAVTSARAGFRKPHTGIYQVILDQLGIPASETIFVGDSWGPDVLGPLSFGITAIHIDRSHSWSSPDLVEGSHRISSLDELLSLPALIGRDDATELL